MRRHSLPADYRPRSATSGYQLLWVDKTAAPNVLNSVNLSSTSYSLHTTSGDLYAFALSSINQYGSGTTTAPPSAYAGYGAPGTTTLSVARTGSTSASLSWTALAHSTGYYVWRKQVPNDASFTQLPFPLTITQWSSMTFGPSGSYQYEIQGINGSLRGAVSSPVQCPAS